MEFLDNSNNENENKNKRYGILVPFIYIKRALIRIWNFVLKGLSLGFKCNNIFIFYKYIIVIFYLGIPIILENRNNQFVEWLKRNGGFKKEFIINNLNNDVDEIL